MKFSYFPGCTLKTKGKDLDIYARKSAEALGFALCELADWQCCGAVYPMAKDEIATKLSSVRALVSARDEGRELVTLCSACHNVIKQVNNDMKTDADIALRVNNYLGLSAPYHGETTVLHYLEVLRDVIGFDEHQYRARECRRGQGRDLYAFACENEGLIRNNTVYDLYGYCGSQFS